MVDAAAMTSPLGAARFDRTAGRNGDGHGHGSRVPTTPVAAIERRVAPDVIEIHPPAAAVGDHAHRADPVLVQACLDGDERAWDTLVERYARLVYSIPRRYGLSTADADDVFQVVFATVQRRLHALRDQNRLAPWLITTTQSECRRLGPPAAETTGRGAPPAVGLGAPPADEAIRWEREQQVHQALQSLDDCCRALLTALFLDPATPGSATPRARCFQKLEAALCELGFAAET